MFLFGKADRVYTVGRSCWRELKCRGTESAHSVCGRADRLYTESYPSVVAMNRVVCGMVRLWCVSPVQPTTHRGSKLDVVVCSNLYPLRYLFRPYFVVHSVGLLREAS